MVTKARTGVTAVGGMRLYPLGRESSGVSEKFCVFMGVDYTAIYVKTTELYP